MSPLPSLGLLTTDFFSIHYLEIGIALVAFGIFFQFLGMSYACLVSALHDVHRRAGIILFFDGPFLALGNVSIAVNNHAT